MFKQNSSQYSVGLVITNVKNIYDNNNQWSEGEIESILLVTFSQYINEAV